MSTYEQDFPVAIVDKESSPPQVIARYATIAQAEWHIRYLAEHGGSITRAKAERSGYGIDAPPVLVTWIPEGRDLP